MEEPTVATKIDLYSDEQITAWDDEDRLDIDERAILEQRIEAFKKKADRRTFSTL